MRSRRQHAPVLETRLIVPLAKPCTFIINQPIQNTESHCTTASTRSAHLAELGRRRGGESVRVMHEVAQTVANGEEQAHRVAQQIRRAQHLVQLANELALCKPPPRKLKKRRTLAQPTM